MPPPHILIDPHPLLGAAVFETVFPKPLGDLSAPSDWSVLFGLEHEAPVARDEATRAAVRDLLRCGGFKPTGRNKPASEYLVKAAESGRLGPINPAVDACNIVSLHSGLPMSVVDLERAAPPFRIEIADEGARYVFNASGQELGPRRAARAGGRRRAVRERRQGQPAHQDARRHAAYALRRLGPRRRSRPRARRRRMVPRVAGRPRRADGGVDRTRRVEQGRGRLLFDPSRMTPDTRPAAADPATARADYDLLARQLGALLDGEDDWTAAMATVACELHHADARFHWTGFYRAVRGGEPPETSGADPGDGLLVVGPYQGGHGCLRIPFARGVCGAAARERRTQLVPDVEAFPGHIACSSSTRSEIVVPVVTPSGRLLAVLDIDSDWPGAFDEADQAALEALCADLGRRFAHVRAV